MKTQNSPCPAQWWGEGGSSQALCKTSKKGLPKHTSAMCGCFLHPTTTSYGFYGNIIVLLSWSCLTSLHSHLEIPWPEAQGGALPSVL